MCCGVQAWRQICFFPIIITWGQYDYKTVEEFCPLICAEMFQFSYFGELWSRNSLTGFVSTLWLTHSKTFTLLFRLSQGINSGALQLQLRLLVGFVTISFLSQRAKFLVSSERASHPDTGEAKESPTIILPPPCLSALCSFSQILFYHASPPRTVQWLPLLLPSVFIFGICLGSEAYRAVDVVLGSFNTSWLSRY